MSLAMAFAAPAPPPVIEPPLVTRCGTPSRTAILTALAAAAVERDGVRTILMLARTGRPKSLTSAPGRVRWLALRGLLTLYPEANETALSAALGCRASTDRRRNEARRRAELEAVRNDFTPDQVMRVAREVSRHEDAQLTAKWIWPFACAVAGEHTGAEAMAVMERSGRPGPSPQPVARARKIAAYLTMCEADVNLKALAAASGLDRKTLRENVQAIEDARDDPAMDETLDALAAELHRRLDEELSQW
ncbi:MAG: hypothetical protein ACK4Z5_03330 [Brevundimonas sp.]